MRRRGPMHKVGSLVSDSLRGLNLETRVKEQTCLMVWDEVVGEQVSRAAQPEYARDGKLFVVTKSPVWAQELSFLKADMIERLNLRVGANVLKDIVFKVGRMRERATVCESKTEEAGLEGIILVEDELDKVESAVQAAGEGAGETFRSLLTTALKLEKWKEAQGWTPCSRCGALQNTASGICPICRPE